MLALLRRDFLWFFLITIGFLSTAVVFSLESADEANTGSRIFYLIGILVICLPCFSLISSELKESHLFLQILPVTAAEIVTSRFLLVLAQVILFWSLVLVMVTSTRPPMSDTAVGIGFINICAILSLLLTAVWYWGIFRFGFARSTKIMSVVYFGIIIAVIYMAEVFGGGAADRWVGSRSMTEWALLLILSLALYFLLMRFTIRAKIAGGIDQ